MTRYRASARALVAVVTTAAIAVGAAPGQAAPKQRIGPVKDLTVEISKPSTYRLAAAWDTLSGATSYKVTLASSGTVLAAAQVNVNRWVLNRALPVGSTVSVKVVPMAGKRPGRPASVSAVVPDLTAPTAVYTVGLTDRTATVTETELADDLSPVGSIIREIDWDNGLGWQSWTSGSSQSVNTYPAGKAAYHPRVRLTDQAGNTRVLDLTAVAIDDTEAPTGSFQVGPAAGWATFTKATLTQLGELADDVSAPGDIRRTVSWGDGTTTEWATATPLQHVYAAAGTYHPEVTLTDESGRTSTVGSGQVAVQVDGVAPRVKLTKPAKARSVRAWKTLRGKTSDVDGSGVKGVSVRVVEKRGGRWFGYRAPGRTWVKAASQSAALRRSRAARVTPVDGLWRVKVAKLRKGRLVVKVSAADNVGNRSAVRTYRQRLTAR